LIREEDHTEHTDTVYDGTATEKVKYSSHQGWDYFSASAGICIVGIVNIQGSATMNGINGDRFYGGTFTIGGAESDDIIKKMGKSVTIGASIVGGKVFDTKGHKMNGGYLSEDFILQIVFLAV